MSRIGKRPISITSKVKISYKDRVLEITGPKGVMNFKIHELLEIDIQEDQISIQADYRNDSQAKSLMGTTQAIILNMVNGVTNGFTKQLNLVGVGYKASVSGSNLELNLGFSHPIKFNLPKGVEAKVQANTQIILESCNKQLLGQVAADIRKFRPPEPYKGKGIIFDGEVIRRKVGKSGKK